jgi:hypothetical protein
MGNSGKNNTNFTIKVPKGTIVKVEGHPVKLKESLYIRQVDNTTFKLENQVIMDADQDEE